MKLLALLIFLMLLISPVTYAEEFSFRIPVQLSDLVAIQKVKAECEIRAGGGTFAIGGNRLLGINHTFQNITNNSFSGPITVNVKTGDNVRDDPLAGTNDRARRFVCRIEVCNNSSICKRLVDNSTDPSFKKKPGSPNRMFREGSL